MKITIQGQDYSSFLDAAHPLTIERTLNAPSACRLWLSFPADCALAAPQRNQAIAVTGDDGTPYFTGYLAVAPLPEYAGLACEGPRYRIALVAVSDELLLDQAGLAPAEFLSSGAAGALVTSMVTRTGLTSLATQGLSLTTPVNNLHAPAGAPFSKRAGQLASQSRAAYRALNAALWLSEIPGAVHALSESDGSLTLANLSLVSAAQRALANDITVCGEHEPAAYVTEYFLGDGATSTFYLAADPYTPPAAQRNLLSELFNESAIDPGTWINSGQSSIFTLGASGLAINGGSGVDGATTLTWQNPVEMGGTLLLESTGVTLAAGSTGILSGLFVGGRPVQAACVAGFCATAQSGTGAVTLQPLVMGAAAGATFQINPAHQYALRIRIHCCESERNLSFYRTWGDNGLIASGGQFNTLPARLQFDIQECIDGVASMPVTLYDGSAANLPPTCDLIAASCIDLRATMRALNLANLGSAWVVTTPPGGGPVTRRQGATANSAECHVSGGRLDFYTGFAPPAGTQIAVSYRTAARAVGRAVNTASQQALMQSGLPPVCAWTGTVTAPTARSSQDCRNAAQVLAEAASSQSALWAGSYKTVRASLDSDVWPGDALQLHASSAGIDAQVVVRSVKLTYRSASPDLVHYDIAFANDWADDLAIHTGASVPSDAQLPAAVASTPLPNLSTLAVAAISGSTVTIDTGVAPPSGGGFEIRRRDNVFMPGQDTDLVLRSNQQTITFTRAAFGDRYYIRMYDAATPPSYSEFSAALFFNLPLGS